MKPAPTKTKRAKRSQSEIASWEGVNQELFESLRNLRRQIAGKKGLPPYLIFSDAALRDMARLQPTTLESFLQVHGVGQKKTDDYGKQFTQHIQQFSHNHQPDTNIPLPSNA